MNNSFSLLHFTLLGKTLNNVSRLLPVVSPLILQPLTVALHAPNLLAIVIWNRVRNRVSRWINTEALDTVEEFFLFLLHLQHVSMAS